MRLKLFLWLILIFSALMPLMPTSSVHAQECLPSRLPAKAYGRLIEGKPAEFYSQPNPNTPVLGKLESDVPFLVIGDSQCIDGLSWLHIIGYKNMGIDSYDPLEGWAIESAGSEYWLETNHGVVFSEAGCLIVENISDLKVGDIAEVINPKFKVLLHDDYVTGAKWLFSIGDEPITITGEPVCPDPYIIDFPVEVNGLNGWINAITTTSCDMRR